MDPIGRLKAYLSDFASGLRPLEQEVSLSGYWLQRKDEGSLFLDLDEQFALREIVEALHRHFGRDGKLSLRATERAIQDAMFAVADSRGTRGSSVEERIKKAVRAVREALTAPVREYDWWIPLRGIDHAGLPFTFADQEIRPLDSAAIEQFQAARTERLGAAPPEPDPFLEALVKMGPKSPGWKGETLRLRLTARDEIAAQEAAWSQARQTVDVLNFFSDLIPHHHGKVMLPAWGGPDMAVALCVAEDGSVSAPMELKGPISHYSLQDLRETGALEPYIRAAENLIRAGDRRRELDDVRLAALEWAGRATIARGREEGFLLFAIALESLFLADGDPRELGYRLALRVACFLEEGSKARGGVAADVRRLYNIRSAIVHSGSYQASDQELHSMRGLAKRALLRALTHDGLSACGTKKEAGAWFETLILS